MTALRKKSTRNYSSEIASELNREVAYQGFISVLRVSPSSMFTNPALPIPCDLLRQMRLVTPQSVLHISLSRGSLVQST